MIKKYYLLFNYINFNTNTITSLYTGSHTFSFKVKLSHKYNRS